MYELCTIYFHPISRMRQLRIKESAEPPKVTKRKCVSEAYTWKFSPVLPTLGLGFGGLLPFFFFFLGPPLLHMQVPRLEVESELQLQVYNTAMAMPHPSCIFHLCCILRQWGILNPLREARDGAHILMDTIWFCNLPQRSHNVSHNVSHNRTSERPSFGLIYSLSSWVLCLPGQEFASRSASQIVNFLWGFWPKALPWNFPNLSNSYVIFKPWACIPKSFHFLLMSLNWLT